MLSISIIFLREWSAGGRDELATAITGAFLRQGVSQSDIENIIVAVGGAAGDKEARQRAAKVEYQKNRLSQGDGHVPGWPRLAELVGEEKVRCIKSWLGAPASDRRPPRQGPVKPATLADLITRSDSFATDESGQLYVFEGGVYRQNGEQHVEKAVLQLLKTELQRPDQWTSYLSKETAAYIRADSQKLWRRPPLDVLNVKNGLYDLSAGVLKPHSPEFLSAIQLGAAYDPNARGEFWARYIADWFSADAIELAFEIPALLMVPLTSLQKAFFLYNESGGNGKSRYFAGLTAFLGEGNVSHISLQDLEGDRFAAAGLAGKLANIYSDLSAAELASSSMLKSITGGDSIRVQRKFSQPFDLKPFARLLFSGNALPRSKDATEAFFRRMVVIRFERKFDNKPTRVPEHVLDQQISSQAELSWLLNEALKRVGRIQRDGLTMPHSVKAQTEEFRAVTDPLNIWLRKNTVLEVGAEMAKEELFNAYTAFSLGQGISGGTQQAFGGALRRTFPNLEDGQRMRGGKRVWCYIGIRFCEPAQPFSAEI
jgi:putative DNA primase/helicase